MDARRELVRAIGERYREVAREDKLRILDEFVAVTEYHCKHSIRVLNSVAAAIVTARPPRLRLYDEAVREVLIVLWEAADRICGKRLKALVPVLLPALERHQHLKLDADVREKVLAVSASTIDRMLAVARGKVDGRRTRASAKPAIRRAVPVRTFADWNNPLPGFMEADLVSHGGENVAGSFAHVGAHRNRERVDRVRRARRARGLVDRGCVDQTADDDAVSVAWLRIEEAETRERARSAGLALG